ncbi:hypothetical protein Tco_0600404 [Tanacetum coccineum]|uniref:RNA-directed DNA polymerase, eukaryota, reverse transcriptase zinc-binding domain protein n=1 Tax=Tanacetum coccineum TaxID=301880 RepID=A0ABQ4WBN0_9ASTR
MNMPNARRQEYRKRQVDIGDTNTGKDDVYVKNNKWHVKEKETEGLKKSANKFSVPESLPEDDDQELRMLKERMIMDQFLDKKLQPTLNEALTWSKDMIKYFKDKWEENRRKEMNDEATNEEFKNVLNDTNVWNIRGMNTYEKQKKVMNLVSSEQLKVVELWWDGTTMIQILKLSTGQAILFFVLSVLNNFNSNASTLLSANEGTDRRSLWKDLIKDMILLNKIEVEDTCKSGLYFTWTKNLYNAKVGIMTWILKKLDKVMSNEDFIKQYPQAYAKNSLPIVEERWTQDIQDMYQVVKKLKSLKSPLTSLAGVKEHFETFLGTSHPVQVLDTGDNLFHRRISNKVTERMIGNLSDAKIKSALFNIDDSKAPSPDGFTVAFFKKSWKVIGADLCNAVREFFISGKL